MGDEVFGARSDGSLQHQVVFWITEQRTPQEVNFVLAGDGNEPIEEASDLGW